MGWAFGLGLERIAMILFSIPDIRLFWSEDTRFLRQFKEGQIITFKPYSKYPPCYKDLSFWLPEEKNPKEARGAKAAGGGMTGVHSFHENDFCEIVRDVAGDLIESVTLVRPPKLHSQTFPLTRSLLIQIDEFTNKKTGRNSKCYRLNYRSMDRSLLNEEVNALQDQVIQRLVEELHIEPR